jgi:hypothetical protein
MSRDFQSLGSSYPELTLIKAVDNLGILCVSLILMNCCNHRSIYAAPDRENFDDRHLTDRIF